MEPIIELDKSLFLLLNGLHADWMDPIMELISSRFFWIPLYAVLLFYLVKTYGLRSLYVILFVVILISLSDQLSVQLFKNNFERLRPCHDESIKSLVYIVNGHCGGQYGFVSSHATNVFGLALFIGQLLQRNGKWWLTGLLIWAALVGYSRIYLGVHFPLDVICGALFGMMMARLVLFLLSYTDKKLELKIFEP